MIVDSDECGKEFELELKETKEDSGQVLRYFDCPHCENRYEVLRKPPK